MTREHDDKRLSEAYRELAEEKAPAELDDRILAMAAREARTRYGLARAWIRPVAWAAMIALSLAIVLEVTRYAEVTAPPVDLGPQESVPAQEEGRVENDLGKLSDAPAPQQASSPPLRRRDSLPAASGEADLLSTRTSFSALAEKKEQAESCDAEARVTAEAWYECVVALRDAGLAEPARLELEALEKAFPEFRAPADE